MALLVPMTPTMVSTPVASARHRRARLRRGSVTLIVTVAITVLVRQRSHFVQPLPNALVLANSVADRTESYAEQTEMEGSPCQVLYLEALAAARPRMASWEKMASDGRIIYGFGLKASKLLNSTLAKFDRDSRVQLGDENAADDVPLCAEQGEALEKELKEQLHEMFLVQRSTVEQALYQRLKRDLLRMMRRRRGEPGVWEKLKLLHAAMADYDEQAAELQPFFVLDSERDRAEKRLSELQWSIADTIEAKEMKQRWKMEQMRRLYMRQPKGVSVSLSPGMHLMLRPEGFGNLQIYSRRQVGPPHNPNEISIGVHNDGKISDIYNNKANPPLVKFQPTIGIQMSID